MKWNDANEFLKELRGEQKRHRGFDEAPPEVDPSKLPKGHRPGFIYFIGEMDGDTLRAVKIGYSNKTHRRKKNLQTGNSDKLVLLNEIPGTEHEERSLHRLMDDHRKHKEWFYPVDAVMQLMQLCVEHDSVPPNLAEQLELLGLIPPHKAVNWR